MKKNHSMYLNLDIGRKERPIQQINTSSRVMTSGAGGGIAGGGCSSVTAGAAGVCGAGGTVNSAFASRFLVCITT